MGRPKGSKNRPKIDAVGIGEPYVEQVNSASPETKYQIVEVDKPRPNVGWDKESRETVMTLAAHPGFITLLQKLATQAALLKAKLVNDRHKNLSDVEFIQSGIFWCNWLKSQLDAATTRMRAEPQEAMDAETRAFKELQATLNKVGED